MAPTGSNSFQNTQFQQGQDSSFDDSSVLTNMTLCYFVGNDVLDSHLSYNNRWRFTLQNNNGLKTYLNDLTFGTNLLMGESSK